MTQEEKTLLLQDLSARLPYEVQGITSEGVISPLITKGEADWDILTSLNYRIVKHGWRPYLRTMSSMTEEEINEYLSECDKDNLDTLSAPHYHGIDWLNKKMFDYRGLIPMGLGLEAPEDMYNTKN